MTTPDMKCIEPMHNTSNIRQMQRFVVSSFQVEFQKDEKIYQILYIKSNKNYAKIEKPSLQAWKIKKNDALSSS